MRLSKKGDLALSTNAIVVLIIAVIMLGLIITFVTQGFGAVSNKFFGEVEKMPDPTTPSSSKPITLSDVIVKGPGDDIGFKVSVFNAGAIAEDVTAKLECAGIVLADPEYFSAQKRVEPRKFETFTIVGKLADNAEPGNNLCSVSATGVTNAADVVILVRE